MIYALIGVCIVVGLVLVIAGPRIQRSRDRKYLRERKAIADLRLAEYRRDLRDREHAEARAEFRAALAERENGRDVESPPAQQR